MKSGTWNSGSSLSSRPLMLTGNHTIFLYSILFYSILFPFPLFDDYVTYFPSCQTSNTYSHSSLLSANDLASHTLTENLRWELPQATTIMSLSIYSVLLSQFCRQTLPTPSKVQRLILPPVPQVYVYGWFHATKAKLSSSDRDCTAHKA